MFRLSASSFRLLRILQWLIPELRLQVGKRICSAQHGDGLAQDSHLFPQTAKSIIAYGYQIFNRKKSNNERQIRRWKREETATKAAGLDSSEASAKVKEWQGRQQEFLAQTVFKRQYGREQISIAKQPNRGIINAQDKVNTRITEESFLRLIDCIPTNRAENNRNNLQLTAMSTGRYS